MTVVKEIDIDIGRPITKLEYNPDKSKVYALSSNKVKLLSFVNSLLVIFILEVNHIECLVFLFSWENPVPTYSFQTIFWTTNIN